MRDKAVEFVQTCDTALKVGLRNPAWWGIVYTLCTYTVKNDTFEGQVHVVTIIIIHQYCDRI